VEGEFQEVSCLFCLNRNFRNAGGYLATDIIEEILEIDVLLGYRRNDEIESRGSGKAGLFADEPFDRGLHGNFLWERLALGWGELDKENSFLFITVTDERWDKNFFGKGELEFACNPACGKFPCDGGGEAGVAGVRPVDMPAWNWAETETQGDGFALFDRNWFGEQVDDDLGSFGDGAGPEGGVEQ
jgi:hypothetical protein